LLNFPEHPDVYDFFSDREKAVLEGMNAEIIYPFVVMNQVKGFVILGKKETGFYDDEELKMLSVLFEQASFAFENALLYRQQRERSRKMYRADRMATLGELAAGTAHEIRNPLTSIRSTIQYLQNRIDDPQDKSLAEGLISEVDRINDIIQNMLSFAKLEELKIEKADLKDLIGQILKLVENSAKRQGIEITMVCEAATTSIFLDQNLIKQAFINILMNAIQAIDGPDGKIRISVRTVESGKTGSHHDMVFLVEVSDNGQGIPSDLLEKIFDPFYTTKQEGTGLGLSITYSIIHRHGGEIEIRSEPGKGTVTTVKLPGKATK
jgi:signal transduction histidine kinase